MNNVVYVKTQTSATLITKWYGPQSTQFDLRHFCLSLVTELSEQKIENYMIVGVEHPNYNPTEILQQIKEDNILFVHTDHLQYDDLCYSHNVTIVSDTIHRLISAAQSFPNKNISFISKVINLDKELTQVTVPSNLTITYYGAGNLGFNIARYNKVSIVTDKQFDCAKHFLCLNNKNRLHRTALVAYLFDKNYDQFGNITYIDLANANIDGFVTWCYTPIHNTIKSILQEGFGRATNDKLLHIPRYNSPTGFDIKIYQSIFVEIISDTTFIESGFINDKYVTNIHGAAFPILIASVGTVAQLRALGFDLFDDVIDHSYDQIEDHALRLEQAIHLNKHILTNDAVAKELWQLHRERFVANYHYFHNEFKMLSEKIHNDCCSMLISGLKLK